MLLIFYIDLPIVEGDVVPLVFLDGDLGDICEGLADHLSRLEPRAVRVFLLAKAGKAVSFCQLECLKSQNPTRSFSALTSDWRASR